MSRDITDPGGLDLPDTLGLDTEDALDEDRASLAHLWHRAEVRTASRVTNAAARGLSRTS